MFFKTKITPPPAEISGVRVRPSSRARRISLRVEARTGEVVLVFPPRGSARRAAAFIEENRRWIEKQRAKKQEAGGIAPGAALSVAGRRYIATHAPGRGAAHIDGDRIIVRGDAAHFPRRLRDFLKTEAARILTEAAREKSAQLGLKPAPVRVIDPRTRWGSCAHDGRLMFSWRLVLAPPAVLDYVVAHEVAHRVHLNHGKKFWDLCTELTEDAGAARKWLRKNGGALMGCL